MKTIIVKLLGSSWRTSLIGYSQFFFVTATELLKTETNFKHILISAGGALFARIVADSAQAKKKTS